MNNDNYGVDFIARCIASEAYEKAESGAGITVDDALSTTSENPVQNKVITNALSYKPDTYSNNTKVANQKIVQLTKAQFDAIQSKDPNTYYMITDDTTADQYTAGTGIDITNGVISLDADYGATFELDINSSTYVITATLRDQNNQVLSTDTIDLPLESVVVSGSYDAQTEKIILTLQNGNTVEFSVASLVSGLEDTANKVSSISNTSTNTEYPSAAAVYSFVNSQSYDEVPTVGSSDDGKILTASYSGGTGSYSWTSPQTFSQQQADWTEADSSAVDYIKNKPTLAAVATSGSYTDLSDKPSIPAAQVNADWNSSSGVSEILNKPTLAAVATSGSYNDLSNTPSLATVATSGSYNDLTDKPSIPAAQVNADWNSSSGVSEILNKPTLATVATSGSYNDLSNKPTIPAAQIPANWNQTDSSAVDYILNKPTIPAAQVNSDWSASSGVSQILNKPDLSIYLTSSDLSGYATETYVDGKVPDITSNDDGKVLTATYSGGAGSSSWESLNSSDISAMTGYSEGSAKASISTSDTLNGAIGKLEYKADINNAALVEIVDNGAKNKLTQANFSATLQAEIPIKIPAGTYVISYSNLTSTDSDATTCLCRLYDDSGGSNVQRATVNLSRGGPNNTVITVSGDTTFMRVYASDNAAHSSGDTVSGTNFMVCTKAEWDISQEYEPYQDSEINEVPAVGSSDDGKVLTATYSGGVGSYSWATASGGGLSVETDGTNYWITVNGIRLYFASSAPTGTIPNGSLGIGW